MKKNVASQVVGAQMVSATDGSAFTGSVTCVVTVDGGTQSASGGTGPTHEGNGLHTYLPTQAETNGDHVAFTFTGTGAVPQTVQIYTTFPQSGDSFARLGAPAGASVSADIATVDAVVDGIQTDLSNGTDGLGAIKADTAAILVDTAEIGAAGAGLTNLGGMSTGMKAEVNTEVLDVLSVDTFTEPGQGAPTATPTIRQMLHYLYKSWRNKKDNDGTETKLYANDETTVDHKQSTTASGGTVTKGEWGTGP